MPTSYEIGDRSGYRQPHDLRRLLGPPAVVHTAGVVALGAAIAAIHGSRGMMMSVDESEFVIPAPGLNGDYSGSCVLCLEGTDTAMGVTGVAEMTLAAGVALGIAIEQITRMCGWEDNVPVGPVTRYFRLCSGCCPDFFTVGAYPHNVPVITVGA